MRVAAPKVDMWHYTCLRAHMYNLRQSREHILACRGSSAVGVLHSPRGHPGRSPIDPSSTNSLIPTPSRFFSGYGDQLGYLPRVVSVLDENNQLSPKAERRNLAELLTSDDGAAPLILLTGPTGSGKTIEQLALVHGAMNKGVRIRFIREAQRQLPREATEEDHWQIEKSIHRLSTWAACWVDCSLTTAKARRDQPEERPSDRILRLVAQVDGVARLKLTTAKLRHLLEYSPPTVFLFDLNRATPEAAIELVEALKDFWREFCGPERTCAAHRCVITYRQVGQHSDLVWSQLAPRPDSAECQAWVIHELAPFEADAYLVRARTLLYQLTSSRRAKTTMDAEARARTDLPVFQRLSMDFSEIVKLPLLLHMASTLENLDQIRSAKDLYDRFLEKWYDRESQHPSFGKRGNLTTILNQFTLYQRRLGLEMNARGTLVLEGPHVHNLLTEPVSTIRWDQPLSDLMPGRTRCKYRHVRCPVEHRSNKPGYDQFLAHAPLTANSKKSVEFLHHSFTYHAAGSALREFLGPGLPPQGLTGEELATWARRVAVILATDPGRWVQSAEFLGGALTTEEEGLALLSELLRYPSTTPDFPDLCRRLLRGMGQRSRDHSILSPLTRFFERDSNRFSNAPEQLWQELYNELGPPGKHIQNPRVVKWILKIDKTLALSAGRLFRETPLQWPRVEVMRLVGHKAAIHHFCWSKDGRRLLTSSADGTLALWDAGTGTQIRSFPFQLPQPPRICFDITGEFAFVLFQDYINIIRISNSETMVFRTQDTKSVIKLVQTSDFEYVVYLPSQGTEYRLWNGRWLVHALLSNRSTVAFHLSNPTECPSVTFFRGTTWIESREQFLNNALAWSIDSAIESPQRIDCPGVPIFFSQNGRHLLFEGRGWPVERDEGIGVMRLSIYDKTSVPVTRWTGGKLVDALSLMDGFRVLTADIVQYNLTKDEKYYYVQEIDSEHPRSQLMWLNADPPNWLWTIKVALFDKGSGLPITCGNDRIVRAWQSEDIADCHLIGRHASNVNMMELSPNCRQLAAAGDDGTVWIWDVGTCGSPISNNEDSDRFYYSIVRVLLNNDADRIVAINSNDTLEVIDRASGDILCEITDANPEALYVNENVLSVVNTKGPNKVGWLEFIDVNDGIAIHSELGCDVTAWTLRNDTLLICRPNLELAIGHLGDCTEMEIFGNCPCIASCVSISSDGRRVVTGHASGEVLVWEYESGKNCAFLERRAAITQVQWSSDGVSVVIACADGTVCVWNDIDNDVVRELDVDGIGIRIDCLPTSNRVLIESRKSKSSTLAVDTTLWDIKGECTLQSFPGKSIGAGNLVLTKNGKRAVTLDVHGAAIARELTRVTSHDLIAEKAQSDSIDGDWHATSVAIDRSGFRVAIGTEDGTVLIWDANDQIIGGKSWIEARCECIALSDGGDFVLVGDSGGECHLWRIEGMSRQGRRSRTRAQPEKRIRRQRARPRRRFRKHFSE